MTNERRAAVFFDRDGTLMRDVDYCDDPKKVEVFEDASTALQKLKRHDFAIIVITNQSGIGRGILKEEQYKAVEREFDSQLGTGAVDATYFCPHAPDESCECRKPEPGMLHQAAREHGLDLSRSYFVGDKDSDMACGRRAGTKTVLVQTGYGRSANQQNADAIVANAAEAAEWILRDSGRSIR